jgi:hypothetical protein
VGFDVLTTCQPSTVWCSRERLPAAAAQPAQGSSELKRHGLLYYYYKLLAVRIGYRGLCVVQSCYQTSGRVVSTLASYSGGSDLEPETGIPDRGSSGFSSVPRNKCRNSVPTLNLVSFQVHC